MPREGDHQRAGGAASKMRANHSPGATRPLLAALCVICLSAASEGAPEGSLPDDPSAGYDQIVDAAAHGGYSGVTILYLDPKLTTRMTVTPESLAKLGCPLDVGSNSATWHDLTANATSGRSYRIDSTRRRSALGTAASLGFLQNGTPFIYGNFFKLPPGWPDPGSKAVVICDGGSYFWGVVYSIDSKVFQDLRLNGP